MFHCAPKKGSAMQIKSLVLPSVIATALLCSIPAYSQAPTAAVANEAELIGLRQLCNQGDRQACIQFGFKLGAAREHQAEWRKMHPDWWAWEHR
jgi:hypothetical protein